MVLIITYHSPFETLVIFNTFLAKSKFNYYEFLEKYLYFFFIIISIDKNLTKINFSITFSLIFYEIYYIKFLEILMKKC
ncbi:hypothetical protein MARBORIA2_11790 [Methanobrevibacter arboriphilus]|uniref:Uncharacterized protein n=1 Tax=Methanobrevibacter arboriphilus TaxID=39441 RepID=A0ACA8R186_METAZ|nr:hypothetical protein MarbSA_00020 [Methanobrevibacter arboriphilus]GLI12089.1 hypothetical protein MARBORIA2_11790 [Methanobrevibacter arboriphilus]